MGAPPYVAISGFDQDQFYKGPAGAFPGRTAARGGFTAAVLVWPQGIKDEEHAYFGNVGPGGAGYGWWIQRDPGDGSFRGFVITTGGFVFVSSNTSGLPAPYGTPTLIHLTLTGDNNLQLYINGSFAGETALGADTYIPAPGNAVATIGARDVTGANFMAGLLGGVAYTEPAQSADLYGLHWAAVHGARDMVDQPSGYGVVVPAYTNVYSCRRGNNGGDQPVAFFGFKSAAPTWPDVHGLATLQEQGSGLFVATTLNS